MADPEVLKGEGALYVGHHGWPRKKILGFRWSKRDKITLEATFFWQKCFYQYFPIFSIFVNIYTMNACQSNLSNFLKFTNAFDKERVKTLIQQSMRKEKLRKVRLCFKTSCFIKLFKLLFEIRLTQEISKGETGNGK